MKNFIKEMNIKNSSSNLFSNVVYLALGSNLGNKFENIFKACDLISQFSKIKKCSQLYYSPCINLENKIEKDENYFINAVIKTETNLNHKDFLLKCKEIEKQFDRKKKKIHHEARYIDVDILKYNDLIINYETIRSEDNNEYYLQIPHPRMHERLFVLKPFIDINPTEEIFLEKEDKNLKIIEILIDNIKSNRINLRNIETIEKTEDFINYFNYITKIDYLSFVVNLKSSTDEKNHNLDYFLLENNELRCEFREEQREMIQKEFNNQELEKYNFCNFINIDLNNSTGMSEEKNILYLKMISLIPFFLNEENINDDNFLDLEKNLNEKLYDFDILELNKKVLDRIYGSSYLKSSNKFIRIAKIKNKKIILRIDDLIQENEPEKINNFIEESNEKLEAIGIYSFNIIFGFDADNKIRNGSSQEIDFKRIIRRKYPNCFLIYQSKISLLKR